eukprot:1796796-Amphidinium_carterae.1
MALGLHRLSERSSQVVLLAYLAVPSPSACGAYLRGLVRGHSVHTTPGMGSASSCGTLSPLLLVLLVPSSPQVLVAPAPAHLVFLHLLHSRGMQSRVDTFSSYVFFKAED